MLRHRQDETGAQERAPDSLAELAPAGAGRDPGALSVRYALAALRFNRAA